MLSSDLESILQLARIYLGRPQLQLHLDPSWGSAIEGFRGSIKNDIIAKFFSLSQVSISHCSNLGGYAADSEIQAHPKDQSYNYLSPVQSAIGFDLELTSRVSTRIAERVSADTQELEEAPSASSLWTAKEACFKALRGPHQPAILQQLKIGNWNNISSQIETVEILECQGQLFTSSGLGIVFRQELYTFSIFSIRY